ncbi:MAG TPA: hypothetical protein VH439_17280 [Gemmatimonadales bacterium]|jgi:hypothetical protein
MTLVRVYRPAFGEHCLYCDLLAGGDERWLIDHEHAEGWIFCSPICYARCIEACGETVETRLSKGNAVLDLLAYHARRRFTEALTEGHKALAEVR